MKSEGKSVERINEDCAHSPYLTQPYPDSFPIFFKATVSATNKGKCSGMGKVYGAQIMEKNEDELVTFLVLTFLFGALVEQPGADLR